MRFAVIAATAVTVAVAPSSRATVPVTAPIQVDGDMRDWSEVLTSPSNVSSDGDGSTFGCNGSTDRDCPIATGDRDLRRFAWTWDNDDFFFQIQRQSSGTSTDSSVYVALDRDDDGLLESTDVVIVATLRALSAAGAVDVRSYVPDASGGDPLTDANGLSDGHGLPGRLGAAVSGTGSAFVGSAPGSRTWEGRVRWSRIGLSAGAPMRFHVSLGDATGPGAAGDHVGASDGTVGTTAYRAVSVIPDRAASTAPGRSLQLPHWFENEGNVPAVIDAVFRSSTGQDLTLYLDVDLDAVPETWLARDAGGDGILTLPGDWISPLADSNGDGVLDTGLVDPGDGVLLFVEETFSADAGGLIEHVDVVATIHGHPGEESRVRDTIRVGSLTIVEDQRRTAVAGDVAWLPHVIQNNTFTPALIDVSVVTSSGWSWDVLVDPDRDGLPTDAVPLTDGDGSGLPDVTLQPGQSVAVLARATVPPSALYGTQERAFVRVHLNGLVQSVVTDRVVVSTPLELGPHHLLDDGEARYGGAGERIYFAHRLANHLGRPETFDVTAVSDLGWPVTLLSDGDADGRPYDSQPLAGVGLVLPANGADFAFLVAVDVPAGARVGERTRVDVTARAASSATATVHDDAIAAIIRLYDQPDYLVNVSRIPDCGIAYARASGLTPQAQFRFAWMSEPGVVVRVTPVITSDTGTCEDELRLTPDIAGGGWRAEIQRWDGFAWSPLDQAAFDVGDGWRMDGLQPQQARHHLRSARVAASAFLRHDPWALPVGDEIRWRVLTPDRASLLDVSGSFIAFDGTAATATESILLDDAEESVAFAVSNVTFPATGTYVIEAWRTSACAVERLAGATVIEVVDDADLDGLTREEELAAGTDPDDDDADDDGLPDLEDGISDSDGDGLIDARDCDSDDDGVLDGTEAGVVAAAAGTRAGSPCFVPDAAPATTTSPDAADTDGGGRNDGDEDRDRNGRVDAGELDPRDAADDFAGCTTTPPGAIRDLRVARSGDGVQLSWTAEPDPCVTHVVLVSDALPAFTEIALGVSGTTWTGGAAQPSALRAFSVLGDSLLAGPGAP